MKFIFALVVAVLVLDTIGTGLIIASLVMSIKKQMREKQAEQSDQQ